MDDKPCIWVHDHDEHEWSGLLGLTPTYRCRGWHHITSASIVWDGETRGERRLDQREQAIVDRAAMIMRIGLEVSERHSEALDRLADL